MRGDIVLSGFVLTADEWEGMDTMARAQLLRAGGRWSAPVATPPPRRSVVEDPYEAYEVEAP